MENAMSKQRRTALSELLTPAIRQEAEPAAPSGEAIVVARRRSATRDATVQQTVYLPPAVHEQLRELAFTERRKMHDFLMEGLDAVFKARGLKSIGELSGKQ